MVATAGHPAGECHRPAGMLEPRLAAHHVPPAHAESLETISACVDRLVLPARLPERCRVGPDHDDVRRAQASGLRQLPLERAARVVGLRGDAGSAELGEPAGDAVARRPVVESEEDVDPLGRSGLDALLLHGDQEALDAGAEADARGRRAADLLHEVVVAPAAR